MNGGRDEGGRRKRQRRRNRPQQREPQETGAPRRQKAAVTETSGASGKRGRRCDRNGVLYERLRWIAPKLKTGPLLEPECVYCGKPIRDIGAAIQDKNSAAPIHFDCVIARLSEAETLEPGDVICYIGGGRFGVVCFAGQRSGLRNPAGENVRAFTIKKIFEWEDKEQRALWRASIADHYSLT